MDLCVEILIWCCVLVVLCWNSMFDVSTRESSDGLPVDW
jgi:hypothetical protein